MIYEGTVFHFPSGVYEPADWFKEAAQGLQKITAPTVEIVSDKPTITAKDLVIKRDGYKIDLRELLGENFSHSVESETKEVDETMKVGIIKFKTKVTKKVFRHIFTLRDSKSPYPFSTDS